MRMLPPLPPAFARSAPLMAMLVATALLGGCISLGAKPPAALLLVSTTHPVPADQAASTATASTVAISVPVVPQALATQRVPVQTGANSIAYVKDALWTEPPARLFARLMADTITTRTGRLVLSPAQALTDPGARLSGELRNFTLDATTHQAIVTFDAALVRGAGKVLEKRRFEAREPLGDITPTGSAMALSRAANRVAEQVADWLGR